MEYIDNKENESIPPEISNNIKKEPKMQLVISKNVHEDELRVVRENFEDPDLYLDVNNTKLVVGLTPFNKPNNNSRLLPLRPATGVIKKQNFLDFVPKSAQAAIRTNKRPLSTIRKLVQKINDNKPKKRYELKTKEDILELFKESKENEKTHCKVSSNNLMPQCIGDRELHEYTKQEILLKRLENQKDRFKRISKSIAQKSNKKEEDLLFNKMDNYRLKAQVLDYINNQQNFHEKFGNYFWPCTLRRTNCEVVRLNPVNIAGEGQRELWDCLFDPIGKKYEAIQYPYKEKLNKYPTYKDDKFFVDALKEKGIILPNMQGISELKIIGKNIAEEENKNFLEQETGNLFRVYNFEKPGIRSQNICFKKNYIHPNQNICRCKNKSRTATQESNKEKRQSKILI